jgi:hypothetical protein
VVASGTYSGFTNYVSLWKKERRGWNSQRGATPSLSSSDNPFLQRD